MKSFIEKFKGFIRFIVTIFASREFGFMYCLIGTFAQVAHTYFLTESISSFSGGFRTFQAILLSIFISSSLLYFVAIADNSDGKESKRIHWAINIFAFIEIAINFYYYSRHLIIDSTQMQIFDFIFAILVSCLIPITIKLYGGLIKAREWMLELSDKNIKDNIDDKSITKQTTVKFNIDKTDDELKKELEESETILTDLSDSPNIPEYKEKQEIDNIENQETYIQQQIDLALNKKIEEFKELIKTNNIPNDDIAINQIIDKKFESIQNLLTEQILEKFEEKQEIFLKQFTNKCKAIVKNLSGNQ